MSTLQNDPLPVVAPTVMEFFREHTIKSEESNGLENIEMLVFDEQNSIFLACTSLRLVAYRFDGQNLDCIATFSHKQTVIWASYIPDRDCFLLIDQDQGNEKSLTFTASILRVEPAEVAKSKNGANSQQISKAFVDYKIVMYLEQVLCKPGVLFYDAAFNFTKNEFAAILSKVDNPNKNTICIALYSLRYNQNSKEAPYRLTQRLEIEVFGSPLISIQFDEILDHIIGIGSSDTVHVWGCEQGVLLQSMTGFLKYKYSQGRLVVGYRTSTVIAFPNDQPLFNVWTDEFQSVLDVKNTSNASIIAFAACKTNFRAIHKKRKKVESSRVLSDENGLILATFDVTNQLNLWFATEDSVTLTGSMSILLKRSIDISENHIHQQNKTQMCFITDCGEKRAKHIFLIIGTQQNIVLLKVVNAKDKSSCLQRVISLSHGRQPEHANEISIESKPPLFSGCDTENEALIFGIIFRKEESKKIHDGILTDRRKRGVNARSQKRTPAISHDHFQQILSLSTHGLMRLSNVSNSSSLSIQNNVKQNKLPPHSRIGVKANIAAQARVSCATFDPTSALIVLGWSTGFVDLVDVTQGIRLHTLTPKNAADIGNGSSIDPNHSISCLSVIPRTGNPVGMTLQRSIILAGLKSGSVNAWSLTNFGFDKINTPAKLHDNEIVDLIVWKAPIDRRRQQQSSDVENPSAIVVSASSTGEVKVWTLKCTRSVMKSRPSSSSIAQRNVSRLKKSMTSRVLSTNYNNLSNNNSRSQSRNSSRRGDRPLSRLNTASLPLNNIEWKLHAFIRSGLHIKPSQRKLTSICQLSITTLAIGFESGLVERWRLPAIQVSVTAKISTMKAPLQELKLHSGKVTCLASSAMEEVAAASHGRRSYQWLLSASTDCSVILSHLVVASKNNDLQSSNMTAQMELQRLHIYKLSEPIYRTFCFIPSSGTRLSMNTESSTNRASKRLVAAVTAHHIINLVWPSVWRNDIEGVSSSPQTFFQKTRAVSK